MRAAPMCSLSLALLLLVLVVADIISVARVSAATATYGQQQQQQQQQQAQSFETTSTRRERNLDHWDAATLRAYLGLDPSTDQPLPATAAQQQQPSAPAQPVDTYAGIDATVLFYAQWCPNCHAMAPSYDAIGTHLAAGTTRSNLIMALFDCERDEEHVKLCQAVGIKHYPTVMFVGSGPMHDTDPVTSTVLGRDKSAGPAGAVPPALRRATKFQGDYRYPEQLLDWIKTMRSLSRWHRLNTEGFLSVLRRGLFGLFRKRVGGNSSRGGSNSLPVGVPPKLALAAAAAVGSSAAAAGGGVAGGDSAALQRQVSTLEAKIGEYEKAADGINKAVLHATYVIDGVLFPPPPPKEGDDGAAAAAAAAVSDTEPPYSDAFAVLTTTGGWDATTPLLTDTSPAAAAAGGATSSHPTKLDESYLLRTCVVDLTLDYCTRVSTKVTTDYLDELTQMADDAEYPPMTELDSILTGRTEEAEPFCAKFDRCYANDFAGEECRPAECPFRNEVACRYVGVCFSDLIIEEYAEVLMPKVEEGGGGDAGAAAAATAAGGTKGGAFGLA